MASLLLNSYSPLVDTMKMESGDRSFPIWLLVNPRYPSVRPDIWIPILEVIQDKVYRKLHKIIDIENFFIKYIVSDIGIVSDNSKWYSTEIAKDIVALKESILEYHPKILITFGAMTNELVRRICDIKSKKGPMYWSTANLGYEFEQSIANFDITRTNRIPLPLRVTTRGKSMEDYNSYWEDCENYYLDIGSKIAARIIENKDSLKIWI